MDKFIIVGKKKKSRRRQKQTYSLNEILDSDDELPTEYIDLPFVPAYQMDNRFEHIVENKVHKEVKKEDVTNGGNVVARGYLNKKDTFCFQCLEPNTGKKTQQWFLNFLMIKDLHACYTFLNTCLVPSYQSSYSV